jgi:hypothetical protein
MTSNLQDTFQLVSAYNTDLHFANERFDALFHLVYHPPNSSGMHLSLGFFFFLDNKRTEPKEKFTDSNLILTFPHNDIQNSHVLTMLSFIF